MFDACCISGSGTAAERRRPAAEAATAARTTARTATATAHAAGTTRTTGAHDGLRLAGQQAFALRALPGQLARTPDRFRLLARLLLGGLLIMAAKLHLAENALCLLLLLQRLEGLVDVVVANENLHASSCRSDSGKRREPVETAKRDHRLRIWRWL